jgi:hypothetical protein
VNTFQSSLEKETLENFQKQYIIDNMLNGDLFVSDLIKYMFSPSGAKLSSNLTIVPTTCVKYTGVFLQSVLKISKPVVLTVREVDDEEIDDKYLNRAKRL